MRKLLSHFYHPSGRSSFPLSSEIQFDARQPWTSWAPYCSYMEKQGSHVFSDERIGCHYEAEDISRKGHFLPKTQHGENRTLDQDASEEFEPKQQFSKEQSIPRETAHPVSQCDDWQIRVENDTQAHTQDEVDLHNPIVINDLPTIVRLLSQPEACEKRCYNTTRRRRHVSQSASCQNIWPQCDFSMEHADYTQTNGNGRWRSRAVSDKTNITRNILMNCFRGRQSCYESLLLCSEGIAGPLSLTISVKAEGINSENFPRSAPGEKKRAADRFAEAAGTTTGGLSGPLFLFPRVDNRIEMSHHHLEKEEEEAIKPGQMTFLGVMIVSGVNCADIWSCLKTAEKEPDPEPGQEAQKLRLTFATDHNHQRDEVPMDKKPRDLRDRCVLVFVFAVKIRPRLLRIGSAHSHILLWRKISWPLFYYEFSASALLFLENFRTMRVTLVLVLLVWRTTASGHVICPVFCECDVMPPNNVSWAVYCHKGAINDSAYAEILNRLPLTLRSLDIQVPSWRPANKFRWNDNINRFSQLRVLRLVGCGLPAMSRSMRLPSLEVLDLRHNDIDHATMGNFGGMPALRHLDLSHNKLNILPTGVFTYLRALRSLSLANNSITELSTNLLRGLATLRVLHLDGNPIPLKQINDLFNDVPQLDELYLNQCQLNSISSLSLERVPQLRHLGIAGNDLRTVPGKELQKLHHLTVLDLSNNSIQEVTGCAFCSNNLTKLDLSHNLLGLAKEPFHPDAFRNIPLRDLNLGFNHMNSFESRWLGWAQESLLSLALSGNFLKGFNEEFTATLPSLIHLHMAYNDIGNLPVVFPPPYHQLLSLNISGNTFHRLPDNLQESLPNLKELDISHNRFSTFSHVAISYINHIERVFLQGNPWDCSCSIQTVQAHMRERYAMRHILQFNEARCAEPRLVEGQSILSITEVNDCAVLFGARYGISQSSELLLLLAALLLAAMILAVVLLCLYCLRERQYKGSYVTREHSRTPLTMAQTHSCSSSTSGHHDLPPMDMLGDHLHPISDSLSASPPLIPPAPPKPNAAAYFGI
ncbi:unnamed protein product [Caenorhabditis auriculariae]|uniref:LRRCT domain-containing protein n=1 Tax=Caenorhabditis auriculariae TaxID=2777116 RepID=A0A8S1GR36_9PELO|nr:unnamed protein product [Caenorhabditis auriculariae]